MCTAVRTSSPRWPFWLLIAAWVCANCPQAATYAALTWMAEARSFTHQQRLTAQTAAVLAGAVDADVEFKSDGVAPRPPLPPVPPEAVLKKIPLSFERTCDVLPPALRAMFPCEAREEGHGTLRAPPLHGPPRLANLS